MEFPLKWISTYSARLERGRGGGEQNKTVIRDSAIMKIILDNFVWIIFF